MSDYESFILLVRYMEVYDMAGLYRPSLDGMELWLYIFDQFLMEELPAVYKHFQDLGIKSDMIVSQWFMTFFAYRFPLSICFRLLDVFFMFGWPAMVAFSLFLLSFNEKTLLEMNSFENVVEFLKRRVIEPYRADPSKFIVDGLSWSLSKSLISLTSSNPSVWKRIHNFKKKFITMNSPVVLSLANENEVLLLQLREERARAARQQKEMEMVISKNRLLIGNLKSENDNLQIQVKELSQALVESKNALAEIVDKEISRRLQAEDME